MTQTQIDSTLQWTGAAAIIAMHVLNAAAAAHFASEIPAFAQALMQAFWPGPLTLILPRRAEVAQAAAGGQDSVGLRCPSHSVAQALLRADAKTQAAAQDFLNAAKAQGQALADAVGVDLYPAVPLTIARIANVERAQLLVECANRAVLQRFLSQWQQDLHALRATAQGRGIIRWAIDVDPLAI